MMQSCRFKYAAGHIMAYIRRISPGSFILIYNFVFIRFVDMKFFHSAGCMLTVYYYRLYFTVILFKVSKKDTKARRL